MYKYKAKVRAMKLKSLIACGFFITSINSAQAQELRKLDYLPLIIGGSLDITSTALYPGQEENKAISWIKHEPTRITSGAIMEASAFYIAHKTIGKKYPKVVRAIAWTVGTIHFFAFTHNLNNKRD